MTADWHDVVVGQVIRIDVVPNEVLLEIFDFYMKEYPVLSAKRRVEAWQSLVHVCRRWGSLVFGSSRRLNLRLYCTPKTPAKDTLDVWPALPLLIMDNMTLTPGVDKIIAALGQSNYVCEVILLGLVGLQLEKVLVPMQVSFSKLTKLQLWPHGETPLVIPDSFLEGSAPCLRFLSLASISFPGLPKLLLSATHLVYLYLYGIPHIFHPKRWLLSSPYCPASKLFPLNLNPLNLALNGKAEYLEEFVTRIDTPHLDEIDITFFNQIDFDCPRLAQFIDGTPTLRALDEAHVQFDDSTASVTLRYRTSQISFGSLRIDILCKEPDWQLSSIGQVCNFSLPSLPTVENLYIEH